MQLEKMDKFYMDIAQQCAEMSYATRSKVGCVVVKNDRIISFGWNGTPAGWDNACEDDKNVTKGEVLHAELNAFAKLARQGDSSDGSTVYLTLSPCIDCAKLMKQAGVKRIVFKDHYRDPSGLYFLELDGEFGGGIKITYP